MKKRMFSLLLALCVTVSLLVFPAGAAPVSRFSDVTDATTAIHAEVLRLMGVMDGYGDGSFKPNVQLNRAQFCKMATYAMHQQKRLGLFKTVTVFPDVKPSHWAASYINLLSRGSQSTSSHDINGNVDGQDVNSHVTISTGSPIITGFPDGKFHPERAINLGQAVTILLRILGYQDSEIGGVWPDSYIETASIIGLLKGLPADGRAPLTRAQAARLFVNLLTAKKSGGGTLYTLGDETDLVAVDGGSGTMKLLGGKALPMANPVSDCKLTGMHGKAVMDGEMALTFLPTFGESTGSGAGAIVLYEDGRGVGLEALAGNNSYKIYKNGTEAGISDLKKYDVATYYPDTNSIIVTDTRLSVYYESCEPRPEAPTKIRVLNGTELYVLPTAVDTLKDFKPGDQLTLLLTADGRVAGAVKPGTYGAQGNAIGFVTPEGEVNLLCGSNMIAVNIKPEEELLGNVVRLYSTSKTNVRADRAAGGKLGVLRVSERTLGRQKLADGVMIFEEGVQIALSDITVGEIPAKQIRYARTNWAGEVDIVVIDRSTNEIYGRIFWEVKHVPEVVIPPEKDEDGNITKPEEKIPAHDINHLGVEYDNGKRTKAFLQNYQVKNGDVVVAKINQGETGFYLMQKLPKLDDIAWTSWIGSGTVTAGGRTYEVPADVKCYNLDSREWVPLDKAKAYADTADLYVRDGVVRIIEVGTGK